MSLLVQLSTQQKADLDTALQQATNTSDLLNRINQAVPVSNEPPGIQCYIIMTFSHYFERDAFPDNIDLFVQLINQLLKDHSYPITKILMNQTDDFKSHLMECLNNDTVEGLMADMAAAPPGQTCPAQKHASSLQ